MTWMLLVLLYGVLKGVREIIKKKAIEGNTIIEVLFFYTLLSFIMVTPDIKNAMGLDLDQYLWVALKSFIIFLAWILSFHAIKKMPISLYGVLDLSRVLFATLLGTIVLGEVLNFYQIIGLIFVSGGLLLLKYRPSFLMGIKWTGKGFFRSSQTKEEHPLTHGEQIVPKYVIFALISCLLNGLSGLMDKILMKEMNSSQLQFWYMLFLVLYYLLYILVTRTKIRWKKLVRNYWIWILSFLFIIADRALFIANAIPESRVTIMTLIKQSGCLVTILAGRYLYHEKNTGYKLFCALVIITGIVIAVL